MSKRNVLFLAFLFVNLACGNFAFSKIDAPHLTGSNRLDKAVATIQMLPEARALIQNVEQEGSIHIRSSSHSLSDQFGAFWDPEYRRICVSSSNQRNNGKLIGSIIFELHNALISKKLDHLAFLASKNRISRINYIIAVERLEYQNSLNAAKMIEKGIQMGIFPISTRMKTYHSFEEHYRIQQMGGHSGWIGNAYDQLIRNG